MFVVNTSKTRALNIDGTHFLADQPIVGVSDERIAGLVKDGLLVEVETDPEALRKSAQVVGREMADINSAASMMGVDLNDPSGLNAEQRKRKEAEEAKEKAAANAAAAAAEAAKVEKPAEPVKPTEVAPGVKPMQPQPPKPAR